MSKRIQSSGSEAVEVVVFVSPAHLPKVRAAIGTTAALEPKDLAEALRALARHPRVLITEIDRDGFELFRTARDYYPKTRTLMLGESGLCNSKPR